MAGNEVFTFTDDNFENEALKSNGAVLVDFWAAWCGPCKMIAPVVEELAKEYNGKAKIGKLNVDENRQTAINYGVMSIPTILIFKNGAEAERIVGYKTKQELQGILEKHL